MYLDKEYNPDTAVVGLWFGLNYGSILSAYALYKTVEELGYKPVFLNKPVGFWGDKYADPKNIAGNFIHKHAYVSQEFFDGDTLFEFTKKRDNFIVGSDVVWNYEICGKGAVGFFFLDFVPDYKNKISYASSFGAEFTAPGTVTCNTASLLGRIPKKAVGDDTSLEILNLQFGMTAKLVLDPLFLTEQYEFNVPEKEGERYIFTYMENCDSQKQKYIRLAEKIKNVPVKNYADINDYEVSAEKYDMPVENPASVEEWVTSLKNAEFVITDSYFAMCLAIQFEKPFAVMAPKDLPELRRFTMLLKELGLSERLVYVEDDMVEYSFLIRKPIKYETVNKKLDIMRKDSLNWLSNSLQK